jgi:hypothetical protein
MSGSKQAAQPEPPRVGGLNGVRRMLGLGAKDFRATWLTMSDDERAEWVALADSEAS